MQPERDGGADQADLLALESAIRGLVGRYFALRDATDTRPSGYALPLTDVPFGASEVCEAIDSLLSTKLTMGDKVRRFERLFADYIGVKHAVMVNSGSSANLLALAALTNPAARYGLRPGDEVITPAVTWPTTVWPIVNAGLVPVLVDVGRTTLTIDPDAIEAAITPRTRAIMPVHLLGRPCEMDAIEGLARRHDLLIVEDACEAHGARYHGRMAGSFGIAASFSFYFSHHITTIEGGMLVTGDDALADLARSLRAFGWARERTDAEDLAAANPSFDPRFLFVNTGFNLRPTEIQGAFGIHQMRRLEGFVEERRATAGCWNAALEAMDGAFLVEPETADTRHAWFGYPLLVDPASGLDRSTVQAHLEACGIETRPIMSGNIARQPAMALAPHRVGTPLPNADFINDHGLLIGIHAGTGEAEQDLVLRCLQELASHEATRSEGRWR